MSRWDEEPDEDDDRSDDDEGGFGDWARSHEVLDQAQNSTSLAEDLLGNGDDSDSDGEFSFKAKKKAPKSSKKAPGQEDSDIIPDFMFFDFRQGCAGFPANCEIIDPEKAIALLEKQKTQALEALKLKKKDGDDSKAEAGYADVWASGGGEDASEFNAEELDQQLREATFEELNDGSFALIMKPGYRLKLSLKDLLLGGDAARVEREKMKKTKKKSKSKYSGYSLARITSIIRLYMTMHNNLCRIREH